MSSFAFQQDIFLSNDLEVRGLSCHQTEIDKFLPPFSASITDNSIGLASIYGSKGQLTTLAIASKSQVLVIKMASKANKPSKRNKNGRSDQFRDFLRKKTPFRYSFEMDKLATALYMDCGILLVDAKDLLSVSAADRHSLAARLDALGGENVISRPALTRYFGHEKITRDVFPIVARQAWAACYAASLPDMYKLLQTVPSIDTVQFNKQMLQLLSKVIRDGNRLMHLKPTSVKNDIDSECITRPGSDIMHLISKRFRTRIMRNKGTQMIKITSIAPNGMKQVCFCRVVKVAGREAKIELVHGNLPTSGIQSVETIGKEPPTNAEALRTGIILDALQGITDLSDHPFLSKMWFKKKVSWASTPSSESEPSFHFPSDRELNISQKKGVTAILSNKDSNRIVVIYGPPGTGKTTVIAAAVTSIISLLDDTRTVWLVAQSNVAVKNIAEKLTSVDFYDFKILVSKDFHFDWHEHLYEKIQRNVIRSDGFDSDPTTMAKQLSGCRVILCTLGMLSNDRIDATCQLVPPQTVIFDEASQIQIGDYLPLLFGFRSTLRKLVFIGDDKQLAPYGTRDIPDLELIFERNHLRKDAIFLDTQYRMPTPIGNFISEHVYNKKLKSQHSITDPSCCRFVDVKKGLEAAQGRSWKNLQEVDIAIAIAKQLIANQKSFRIFTPYDPQRNLLENRLKKAELPWEDRCFNVDAFQGNEDDYIIISLVRSAKLGFLRENRRTNVMLTRCKKGMIICTSRKFIEGPAADSRREIVRVLTVFLVGRQTSGKWCSTFHLIESREQLGLKRMAMIFCPRLSCNVHSVKDHSCYSIGTDDDRCSHENEKRR